MNNKYKILACALILLGVDILFTSISYELTGSWKYDGYSYIHYHNWDFEANDWIAKYGHLGLGLMVIFNIPFLALLLCSRERLLPSMGFMFGAMIEFGCRGVGIASHPLLWVFGENGRIASSIIMLLVCAMSYGFIISFSAVRFAMWCRSHK